MSTTSILMEKLKSVNKISIDDSEKYANEYDIPIEYVSEMIKFEIQYRILRSESAKSKLEKEMIQIRLDSLRIRCDNYVKEATKLSNNAESALKEETNRADKAEKSLSETTRQLDKIKKLLHNGSNGVSEIELFFSTMNGSSKKLRSIILKALHPDKHQNVDAETMEGINEFFRIINEMIS